MRNHNLYLSRKRIIVLLIIYWIVLGLSIIKSVNMLLPVALLLWTTAIVIYFKDFGNNIEMIGFLICLFIFTLGGQIASNFLGYEYRLTYTNAIESHTNAVIIISLVGLILGYKIGKSRYFKKKKSRRLVTEYDEQKKIVIRDVTKYVFYVTSIFWFADIIEKVLYVRVAGYYSLYAEYSSSLPTFVTVLANFGTLSFYLFISTFPTQRQARIPVLIYITYLVVSLFSGRRIFIAVGLLILLVYFYRSDQIAGTKWITRKLGFIVVMFIPTAMIGLQIYGSTRVGDTYSSTGAIDTIRDFIGSQGYTVNIIKYEQYYKSQIPSDKIYSLYTTVKTLRTNPFTRWFMPHYDFQYGKEAYSSAGALNGNSLANMMSYIVNRTVFYMGGGTGSCYIAELFHDFGYAGVAIGNTILGFVIARISGLQNKGVLVTAIGYLCLENLYKTPRYNFDYVLTGLGDIYNWAIIAIVFVMINILYNKRKNKVLNNIIDTNRRKQVI